MNKKNTFFNLLAESNRLKKNQKSLQKENPEAFKVFLGFLLIIERNLHYAEKQEYIDLAKDFLADQITADDFSYSFQAIYEGINKKLGKMERDESLDLATFLDKPPRPGLGDLLADIYGSCDSFSPDPEVEIAMSDEEELKEWAQILLLKLQEE